MIFWDLLFQAFFTTKYSFSSFLLFVDMGTLSILWYLKTVPFTFTRYNIYIIYIYMKHTAKTAMHFSTPCLISCSLNFNRLMLTSCEIIQMKPIKIRSRSLILKTLTCRQMSLKKTKLIHIGWMKTKRNNTIQNRKTVIPLNNTENGRRYVRLESKYDTYQPYA